MDAFKDWWAQASSRDQLALVCLTVALVIYILVMGILKPVAAMSETQNMRNTSQYATFERVRELAAQWTNRDSSSTKNSSGNVERVVESSFSQHGLRVSGMDASGRSGIRVRFDGINYDKFVAWAYDLEVTQGLRLKDVNVSSSSDPGQISASVLIQK
jgi:general secretion pathway protein M